MITILAAAMLLSADNTLTSKEAKAGWKLLFDGKTTKGWHNFKERGVGAGWVVKDGILKSEDPSHAGDIVTDEKFDSFELVVDFNFEKEQNSGILFHVADEGGATWHSGPEIQIYDHKQEPGVQITGYLYELYDSKVDASKPAGEWNNMHILVTPKKAVTYINNVKYYEFDMTSADFWARVKKSKFSAFPEFAKLAKGSIAIQGDHGVVSFKNIKLRPLKAN